MTNPPSYEQARDELIDVVRRLESGGVPLADSMALWERGEQLATICQDWLDGARAKVDAARRGEAPAAGEGPGPQASGRDDQTEVAAGARDEPGDAGDSSDADADSNSDTDSDSDPDAASDRDSDSESDRDPDSESEQPKRRTQKRKKTTS